VLNHQWLKTKMLPLILGAGISFLIGLLIPVDLLAWFGESSQKKASPQIEVELTLAQTSESTQKSISPQVISNQTQNLTKLVKIPPLMQGKIIKQVTTPSDRKVIALTFDDGPSQDQTNDILYVLKTYDIKATFFVLGQNVKAHPDLTLRIVQHGHAIGNHTWSHPYSQQSKASAARQIDQTTDLIKKITGVKTELFRPPGGYLTNGLASYAQQKKNAVIMWSIDTTDYRNKSQTIINNALKNAKSGGIILLHDGGGNRHQTLVALPHLIEGLQKQGYEFVTIPELLAMGRLQAN